jgi:hypothetical protein
MQTQINNRFTTCGGAVAYVANVLQVILETKVATRNAPAEINLF